jgi:hypothetical protein
VREQPLAHANAPTLSGAIAMPAPVAQLFWRLGWRGSGGNGLARERIAWCPCGNGPARPPHPQSPSRSWIPQILVPRSPRTRRRHSKGCAGHSASGRRITASGCGVAHPGRACGGDDSRCRRPRAAFSRALGRSPELESWEPVARSRHHDRAGRPPWFPSVRTTLRWLRPWWAPLPGLGPSPSQGRGMESGRLKIPGDIHRM